MEATIQDILFPVDFSSSCAAMTTYVKRAAAIYGTRVTLVHVVDLTSHDGFELYVRPRPKLQKSIIRLPAKD